MPARLEWTFLVALAGLPARAGCFLAEGFFRLEGTARALAVLPREPAGPRFLFGFRVGMVISSCAKWNAFVTAPSLGDQDEPSLAVFTSSHRSPGTSPADHGAAAPLRDRVEYVALRGVVGLRAALPLGLALRVAEA